jgi:tRNA-guanine family transglycosylase
VAVIRKRPCIESINPSVPEINPAVNFPCITYAMTSKAQTPSKNTSGGPNNNVTSSRMRIEITRTIAPTTATSALAVGEGQAEMFRVLEVTVPELPEEKPRYLMGVGRPLDIVGAVMRGIDMFDCVLPTRSGRTAQAFTAGGTVNLRNARHREDPRPLDPACGCPTCTTFSRAYMHHLFRAEEILGPMLLTQHNLYHYQTLMAGLRAAIEEGTPADFAAEVAASVGGSVASILAAMHHGHVGTRPTWTPSV